MTEDCCVMCGHVFAPGQPAERYWDVTPAGTLVPSRGIGDVVKEESVCTACLPAYQAWLQRERAPHGEEEDEGCAGPTKR